MKQLEMFNVTNTIENDDESTSVERMFIEIASARTGVEKDKFVVTGHYEIGSDKIEVFAREVPAFCPPRYNYSIELRYKDNYFIVFGKVATSMFSVSRYNNVSFGVFELSDTSSHKHICNGVFPEDFVETITKTGWV